MNDEARDLYSTPADAVEEPPRTSITALGRIGPGLILAAAIRRLAVAEGVLRPSLDGDPAQPPEQPSQRRRARFDWLGLALAAVTLVAGALVFVEPSQLMRDVTYGRLFIPYVGDSRWLTPLGIATILALVLLAVRCCTASRPLVDIRGWVHTAREADVRGALLLALALTGVILAFATADPKVQVFSDQGLWYLLGAALAAIGFVVHLQRSNRPLVPRGALRRTPAWGSMLVSFFIGAALVAALIDIPLFARTTVYPDSQLLAALVLVRFLVALPIGAIVGGYLTHRLPAGVVTAIGMVLAAAGFFWMATWDLESLHSPIATLPLVIGGFGFGLALAPVNAAVLASTDDAVHGLASAFVVVARMVGMLVGISALTTIGLRRYYAAQADVPAARDVCDGVSRCPFPPRLLKLAGIAQEQCMFTGAAVCALIAAVLALVLFRGAPTREISTGDLLRAAG